MLKKKFIVPNHEKTWRKLKGRVPSGGWCPGFTPDAVIKYPTRAAQGRKGLLYSQFQVIVHHGWEQLVVAHP